jgi:8-oxo-dGTP pyrophosphatase MutT (NUDIX family)
VTARPVGNDRQFRAVTAYAGHVSLPVPVQRLGYRTAYSALRVYWWVFRPRSSGVKCVLTHRDDVLLVRHTYGPRGWELPGGSRKRGEPAETTATREIHEELGLSVDAWRSLGRIEVVVDRHRDSLYCFQAEVGSPDLGLPSLTIDRGELAAAEWFPKAQLPSPLGRYTRAILARLDALA